MKSKKIRGGKHILTSIEQWKRENITLNVENLQRSQRDYVKIWVAPYSNLEFGNSIYPEPSGLIRKRMLEALLDIYDNWKATLDDLDEPYYLKIWLHDQRFSRSQVVCAIGDFLDFYETTFHKPENQKSIDLKSYGSLSDRMKSLDWQYALDEEHYNNTSIGEIWEYETERDFYKTRRWFNNRLKKPHRKIANSASDSEIKEYYSFSHGTVWIGG